MKKLLFTGLFFFSSVAITVAQPAKMVRLDSLKLPANTDVRKTNSAIKFSNKLFFSVDKAPEFPGGVSMWNDYVKKHLRYPNTAKNKCKEGKVILSFVVEKNGSLSAVKVLKGLSPKMDIEARRLLKNSPKWIPGELQGYPVRVEYAVPITFSLN